MTDSANKLYLYESTNESLNFKYAEINHKKKNKMSINIRKNVLLIGNYFKINNDHLKFCCLKLIQKTRNN